MEVRRRVLSGSLWVVRCERGARSLVDLSARLLAGALCRKVVAINAVEERIVAGGISSEHVGTFVIRVCCRIQGLPRQDNALRADVLAFLRMCSHRSRGPQSSLVRRGCACDPTWKHGAPPVKWKRSRSLRRRRSVP